MTPDKYLARVSHLRLRGGRISVTDADLTILKGLKDLKSLVLVDTDVTDAGLADIARMRTLTHLVIDDAAITDAGLIHLKGLKDLKKLHLKGPSIVGHGLVHLKSLSSLRELTFGTTKLADAGLECLKDFKGLAILEIQFTHVTKAGLAHLENLQNLKLLSINGKKTTSNELTYLRSNFNLHFLGIEVTEATDTGVDPIYPRRPSLDTRISNSVKRESDLVPPYFRPVASFVQAVPDDAGFGAGGGVESTSNLRRMRSCGVVNFPGFGFLVSLLPATGDVNDSTRTLGATVGYSIQVGPNGSKVQSSASPTGAWQADVRIAGPLGRIADVSSAEPAYVAPKWLSATGPIMRLYTTRLAGATAATETKKLKGVAVKSASSFKIFLSTEPQINPDNQPADGWYLAASDSWNFPSWPPSEPNDGPPVLAAGVSSAQAANATPPQPWTNGPIMRIYKTQHTPGQRQRLKKLWLGGQHTNTAIPPDSGWLWIADEPVNNANWPPPEPNDAGAGDGGPAI